MNYDELRALLGGKTVICEDYEERDAFVDYFREHGIYPDDVMRRDMHTSSDQWLYPYVGTNREIHAYGSGCAGSFREDDSVPFETIAPWIFGESFEYELPDLSAMLV